MPVKLTLEGKPLNPVEAPAAPTGGGVVDALLENADNIPAAPQITAHQPPATADTGTTGKNGVITVDTTEKVPVPSLGPGDAAQMGRVTFGMAATINTGNFENVRPFVQIEVPFKLGQEEAAYAFAEQWVDTRINNIVTAVKASVSGA